MNSSLSEFIQRLPFLLPKYQNEYPWTITEHLPQIIEALIAEANEDFIINNGVAIHKSATIEQNAVIKSPAYISAKAFVGANAYLRSGVLLYDHAHIGAGCEIKQSIIFPNTAIAHFNYIGNSIIGSNVNFEAGAVAANHYNERENKVIKVLYRKKLVTTGVNKFGALVGDYSRIGANSVLSPGTILEQRSVVKRLELVEQVKEE
jgi:NDP-sugar pyrophosphorylase family protein